MKDGFAIRGKVGQPTDVIIDPASGSSFSVPAGSGNLYVDDGVRRILFSPRQVQDGGIIKDEPGDERPSVALTKLSKLAIGGSFYPAWSVESTGEFDPKWERGVRINTNGRGTIDAVQRVTVLTPQFMRVDTLRLEWIPRYFTRELEPHTVHTLLKNYFQKQDIKELEKHRLAFQFLFQTGWYDYTAAELDRFLEKYPEQKSVFANLQSDLKRMQALTFFEDLEDAHKAGQRKETQRRIEYLHKSGMVKLLGEEQFKLQEIKNEYAGMQEKLDEATAYLKALPTFVNALNRDLFSEAASALAEELSIETLPRLELFTVYAKQFARDVKEGRTPTQSADKVLALAVSGWLQGNNAASPDPVAAASLWQARKLILECLNTEDATNRANMATVFARQHNLPVDVLGRMLPMLPPATAYKLDGAGSSFELAAANGGQYSVQLPPEYSHQRPYPVLIVLLPQRDGSTSIMARFREMASRHGYVLVSPAASSEGVLGCLRDLRRRFSVDSDRVFLFGLEEGATAAFEIGLSNPHEFAGVLPMSGDPGRLSLHYWANAQYLPFYVVDGGFNDSSTKTNNELFKKWIRYGYPSMYFEYKGRLAEWFSAELPNMFDWMGRKKRAQPVSQLGTYHTGGGSGEEFCTARPGDNRFYWIGTSDISPSRLFNSGNPRTLPATLQARIATGNELVKTKDGAAANIWNLLAIRTSGVGNVVVWFGPNMIDFTKPVQFRINNQLYGRPRDVLPSLETMLDEVYRTGDRQRLYYARVEVRIQ